MDAIGWFIATLHGIIGHDKTAAVIGQPTGDKSVCVICRFERGEATREAVIQAIGVAPPPTRSTGVSSAGKAGTA